jgi:hypothetical protein
MFSPPFSLSFRSLSGKGKGKRAKKSSCDQHGSTTSGKLGKATSGAQTAKLKRTERELKKREELGGRYNPS